MRKNSQKVENVVQCILCQHWTHSSCVGENNKDIIGPWTCLSCRKTPDLVHLIYGMLVKMKEETSKFKLSVNSQINELTKKLIQREKQIQELTTSLTSQTKDLENVTKELGTLRGAMTGINSQVNVNAGIQVLCGDENVDYVDNNLSFYLKDESINDAYLLDDGIHLTYKGTNRLAQNLNLKLKKWRKNCVDLHSHKRSQHRKKYESLNT